MKITANACSTSVHLNYHNPVNLLWNTKMAAVHPVQNEFKNISFDQNNNRKTSKQIHRRKGSWRIWRRWGNRMCAIPLISAFYSFVTHCLLWNSTAISGRVKNISRTLVVDVHTIGKNDGGNVQTSNRIQHKCRHRNRTPFSDLCWMVHSFQMKKKSSTKRTWIYFQGAKIEWDDDANKL